MLTARLRELLAAGSARPWSNALERTDYSGRKGGTVYTLGPEEDPFDSGQILDFGRKEDAALIVAAVNSLGALLDVVEAAEDHDCSAVDCPLCAALTRLKETR